MDYRLYKKKIDVSDLEYDSVIGRVSTLNEVPLTIIDTYKYDVDGVLETLRFEILVKIQRGKKNNIEFANEITGMFSGVDKITRLSDIYKLSFTGLIKVESIIYKHSRGIPSLIPHVTLFNNKTVPNWFKDADEEFHLLDGLFSTVEKLNETKGYYDCMYQTLSSTNERVLKVSYGSVTLILTSDQQNRRSSEILYREWIKHPDDFTALDRVERTLENTKIPRTSLRSGLRGLGLLEGTYIDTTDQGRLDEYMSHFGFNTEGEDVADLLLNGKCKESLTSFLENEESFNDFFLNTRPQSYRKDFVNEEKEEEAEKDMSAEEKAKAAVESIQKVAKEAENSVNAESAEETALEGVKKTLEENGDTETLEKLKEMQERNANFFKRVEESMEAFAKPAKSKDHD